MEKKLIRTLVGVATLLGIVSLLPSVGRAQTVTCGSPGVLQAAIDAAGAGTTLLVSGTCSENVVIGEDKSSITLNGQGSATINGLDPTAATIQITGRGITIRGFNNAGAISGGRHGIQITRGGTALIDSNIIQNTAQNGIFVIQGSSARIIFNTIQNNPVDGIQVTENSSARIGFLVGTDTAASPNTIQGNGGRGITITRSANARIVGNTIASNTLEGIRIQRDSQADISNNTVNGNGSGGIVVGTNSGVNLGNDTGTTIFDLPNNTTANNTGFGIRCFINSYADGRLGSLNGTNVPSTSFSADCVNSLL